MPVIDGYSRYSCDVQGCQSTTYAVPDSDAADGYVTRRRIDAEGMERSMVLCPEHAAAYAALVKACDAAYVEFETTGKATIVGAGELRELQGKLDAAEKARKWWGDRFRALQKEFDDYKAAHPDAGAAAGEGGES